ncbi:hypothetical protein GA0070563_10899 [Micromonospora carbonacea]|uniref:Uncharacterized protein n=1 Tax=Micromonospora carbonacea TaxID=47853 RepID=A0A1C4ZF11_9ACTN|nr:hypothetical protein GA0070563_10899 [Micromonospora carbonacea]
MWGRHRTAPPYAEVSSWGERLWQSPSDCS